MVMGCQKKGQERYTTDSADIDVVKSLISDYESGNWDAWSSHYADSAKIFHNSLEGVGSKALSETFKETLENVSSYKFSRDKNEIFFERILDDKGKEWVYFWGTWMGTISEINKEIKIPIHIAFEMSGNQIVNEYAYYDPSALRNAIVEKQVAEQDVEEFIE